MQFLKTAIVFMVTFVDVSVEAETTIFFTIFFQQTQTSQLYLPSSLQTMLCLVLKKISTALSTVLLQYRDSVRLQRGIYRIFFLKFVKLLVTDAPLSTRFR